MQCTPGDTNGIEPSQLILARLPNEEPATWEYPGRSAGSTPEQPRTQAHDRLAAPCGSRTDSGWAVSRSPETNKRSRRLPKIRGPYRRPPQSAGHTAVSSDQAVDRKPFCE